MSLRSAPWWGSFVSELAFRSLTVLSAERNVAEASLIEALIEADVGGPAEHAPWWPEALRERSSLSLRAQARRWGCEPRRIRRALARTCVRVGGVDTGRWGVSALRRHVDRLGTEPDVIIARATGVSVEGVKGERRQRGIPPFRAGAAESIGLTVEEREWIRGPEPVVRPRYRPDTEALTVVRRPPSAVSPSTPWRATANGADGPGFRTSAERPLRSPLDRPEPGRPGFGADRMPADESSQSVRRVAPGFFHERRSNDIEQLLQSAPRAREGRQRFVRGEEPTLGQHLRRAGAPAEPRGGAETTPSRPVRREEAPAWRPVERGSLPEVEVSTPAAVPPSVGKSASARPVPSVLPGLGDIPRTSPSETVHVERVRSASPPVRRKAAAVPAPRAAPRMAAKTADRMLQTRTDTEAERAVLAPPLPVVEGPAPAAPAPVASALPDVLTWHVLVGAGGSPLVVRAPDVVQAAVAAQALLSVDAWRSASLVLAGP